MLRLFVTSVKRQLESNPTASTRKKIMPRCVTPEFPSMDISDEAKIKAVLSEPSFGMFSLLHFHWTTGHMLETFENDNRVYCSRVFGTCLPLLMQVCQWLMYSALITHQIRTNSNDNFCPNQAQVEHKIMMASIALLYFIRSFFLWDALVDRTNRQPVVSAWYTIFDAVQEFSFTLCVYWSNLALTFTEPDMINMILNALALEYICLLDNELEELYFSLAPTAGVEVYDKYFKESEKQSRVYYLCWLPWKLMLLGLGMFPICCFIFILYG